MPEVYKLTPQGGLGKLTQHIESIFSGGCDEVYISLISKDQAKTIAQNKTFHKLMTMWHKSGMASFDSVEQIKGYYKLRVGLIDCFMYADGDKVHKCKTVDEIPPHIIKANCLQIPGSWSRATKRQAIEAIDMLINDMHQSGYSRKEFDQMLNEFAEWR